MAVICDTSGVYAKRDVALERSLEADLDPPLRLRLCRLAGRRPDLAQRPGRAQRRVAPPGRSTRRPSRP